MEDFKKISVKDLMKLNYEDFKGKGYEIKGIPRYVNRAGFEKNQEEDSLTFFIQEGNHLVLTMKEAKNFSIFYNEAYMKAASEGELETTVRGFLVFNGHHNMLESKDLEIAGYTLNFD